MSAAPATVIGVRDVGNSISDDMRAVRMIWKRELIRFTRNKVRMITSLAQPLIYLFILGTGLSQLIPGGSKIDYRTFIFPGVLGMTVLFTAIFSALSIVWDREFGFLREMLVAPVRRSALVVGKCLGGATVATFQGAVMLIFCGLVHVPYSLTLLLTLVAEMALLALTLTAFGTVIAARMAQVETFQVVMNFIVLPMFFLSGAVFPLNRLPRWLSLLTKIDPMTYAIDPMRRAVFDHVKISPHLARALNPGMTWGGHRLPVGVELAVVSALTLIMLVAAVVQFSRPE
ncbi:MAG: ABC transporter permease [Acidimicrobiia bacterium]|nr:ABC transporter permease [Acidimicrobiia bacterium]MBV8984354.1 ABC transporter permease [Acidimicrobiia bacterium]MBV9040076.1 ABC transporter permease [Acidimicrobiia bacterium]